MAARRLALPAPPPPHPAEQTRSQRGGGLTGAGGHPHSGAARGASSPPAHPASLPKGCQPAGDSRPPKRRLGKPGVGTAKSHCKGHRGSVAAFCPRWGTESSDTAVPLQLLPCPSAAGRTRRPCPSTFAAAPRLVSKITRNGKLRLNPTSAAYPSPSVHGASRGIKG